MRWAFWRRWGGRSGGPAATGSGPPPSAGAAGARDRSQEEGPRAPAFSGASPRPGGPDLPVGLPVNDLPPGPEPSDPPLGLQADGPLLDLAGVRADVAALVQAALDRDAPAADVVVGRTRGEDGEGMLSIAAMGALGDRLVIAAGSASGAAQPGSAGSAAVVAQGDALAARAAVPLSAVAPAATPDLVRFVVRFACGVPDADPALLPLMDVPSDDLTRVAAGLLAQTVLDGRGDVAALTRELADLLPG